ncbi:MAG: hypothetical protein CMF96_03660 [Candidatus Marinimicrobia bacterium]|nr:hypothetical protein [Candidatus Neomarinimicrobiota bacterium]|tara:strand:- start:3442 stop:4500 length:1059 start_codon:yes stop_codon:yes gene_type:complete
MYYNRNIIGFFIGFIITIIVLEVYLQVSEINNLSNTKRHINIGPILKPNHKFTYFNEGFSIGKVNKYGYYGKDYDYQKSENVKRIALIGDSYVEGIQVFERNHFRSKLEKLLNKGKVDNIYQVLNFGRSGFNLNDIYCYNKNFISSFEPSTKLVFISPGDLISRGKIESRPYAYIENNEIKIDYNLDNNSNNIFNLFRGKSIILGYINRSIQLIKNNEYKSILFGKLSHLINNDIQNIKNINKIKSLSELTKKIILDLRKENCIFVIHKETTVSDYDYLINEFIEFSKKNNINYIDLSPLFYKLKIQNINFNYWPLAKSKGHFNEKGHTEIANYIYEYLKRNENKNNKRKKF